MYILALALTSAEKKPLSWNPSKEKEVILVSSLHSLR
jgi:hypothetical protein